MASRLTIREDDTLPPGWVSITLAMPHVPEDVGVTITRRSPSEKPHLGPLGWQSAAHAFPPRLVRSLPDQTELVFGPEVTAHLVVDMDVMLGVPLLRLEERHFWPDISHGAAVALPPLPPMPSRPPPPPALPLPPSPPLPPAAAQAPVAHPTAKDETTKPEEAPKGPVPPEGDGPAVRRRPAIAAGCVVLLAAMAFLVLGPLGERWRVPAPIPDPPSEPPARPQATAPERAAAPTPDGFGQRYERLLRDGGQAEQLLALGREAMAARETDTGFNAIALAADRGAAAAKFMLGEWYDPLRPRTVPLTPDAAIAAAYYQDAGRSGHSPANAALTRLCNAARDPATAAQEAFATFDLSLHCQSEPPR